MLAKTSVHVTVMHPHPVMAAGLEAAFGRDAGFQVRRVATGVADGANDESAAQGGVIVADYQTALDLMARHDGAGERFGRPRVLVVGAAHRGWQVRQALQGGVHGYVSSECRIDELLAAVRRVADGERYLCAAASQCIAESFSQQHLTPRELDVLRLVGEGLDNKTISRRLGIALGTVKAHVRTLLDKLGASSRTEAVAAGLRRGFIGGDLGLA